MFVTGSLTERSSGPFLSLLETAKALLDKGHPVGIVGTHGAGGNTDIWKPATIHGFKRIGSHSLHYVPKLSSWLRRAGPVDIVNLQGIWLYTNYVASKWCRRNRIPYILTVHGNLNPVALGISRLKKKIASVWFARKMLEDAACLHALNYSEYESIRRFGLNQPVCIIRNGVSLPSGREARGAEIKRIRRETGLEDRGVCLYMGRLHPIKGLDNLVRAWAKTGPARNDWTLVLAGPDEGGYRRELEKMCSRLNLEGNVKFAGPRYGEDKTNWFYAADFFVLPSRSEGFAMAPLEAMAHGIPMLLTRGCNFPDVSKEGLGIITGGSPDELRDGLMTMTGLSGAERSAMGRKGREWVSLNCRWGKIADELLSVYEWILGVSDRPSCVLID